MNENVWRDGDYVIEYDGVGRSYYFPAELIFGEVFRQQIEDQVGALEGRAAFMRKVSVFLKNERKS